MRVCGLRPGLFYPHIDTVAWELAQLLRDFIFSCGVGVFLTDPSTEDRGFHCTAGLECILNIIRALRMGSCLSADGRTSHPQSPSSTPRVKQKKKPWKKTRSRAEEEQLRGIPGRIFMNGASGIASLFTQQGKKGTNQDAMIVWECPGSP
ncbi:hypothetical protein ACLOJK_023062 [Asimina triloba]